MLLAGAALVLCSTVKAGVLCGTSGLNTGEVTFNGADATACTGENPGTATGSNLGITGDPFAALTGNVTPDGSSKGSLSGVDFTFTATSDGSGFGGDWMLAWSGFSGPITIDLALVVQQATTGFATYFFQDLILAATPGSGTWLLTFLSPEDQPAASLSLFARDARFPTPPPTGEVSEPATLALFAFATLGLAVFARRRPARR
jgi:hypothetical protein